MSYYEAVSAECAKSSGAIVQRIRPREKSIGAFSVRRALPASEQRAVGPFVFFDHMGPATLLAGEGIQVRPHPHIGLATMTYLFSGQIVHRDSLGIVQPIEPGAVNLMTAGRGIVHSERSGDDLNEVSELHGIQSWLALPEADEDCEPAFDHYAADEIPSFDQAGVAVAVVMGAAFGVESPVRTFSPTLFLDCVLPGGSEWATPAGHEQLAVYVVEGSVAAAGESVASGEMAVLRSDATVRIEARVTSRLIVIGGRPLGKRHLWWNFVARDRARIEQAKQDWRDGAFAPVPGDAEFIPLPD